MKNANVLLVMVFFLSCNIGATKADNADPANCEVCPDAVEILTLIMDRDDVHNKIARVIGNHCREPHQRSCPDVPLGIYVANKIISIVKNRPQLAVAIMEQFKKDYLKERNEYLNQH